MQGALPTDLLLRLMSATDEEIAGVRSLLRMSGEPRTTGQRTKRQDVEPVKTGLVKSAGCARPRCEFQRVGRMWRVVYGGGEFLLEDTLGARYLDYLLHHPNVPVSAFDLEVAITPEKGRARDRQSIQLGLDEGSVREYLRELERLRAERDQAEDAGDCGQAERLEKDIAAIEAELKSGGRSVDPGERARGNVNKALAAVRKRLRRGGQAERAFAAHLESHLSLGFKCLYSQPEGGIWG